MYLLRKEIFALLVATISILIVYIVGYFLTGWNLDNFGPSDISIMLALMPFMGAITGSILVYGFKPRVDRYFEKHDKDNSEAIAAHKTIIIDELEKNRELDKFNPFGTLNTLRNYRYKRILMQHFFTGHKTIFDLAGKTYEIDAKYTQLNRDIYDTLYDRIKLLGYEMGFPKDRSGSEPYFDHNAIARQIVLRSLRSDPLDFRVEFRNNQNFVVIADDESGRPNIVAGNMNRILADKFTVAISDLAIGEPMASKLLQYAETCRTNTDIRCRFESDVKGLFDGIRLNTRNIEGVCDECIRLHKKNQLPQYNKQLSDCASVRWLSSWLTLN